MVCLLVSHFTKLGCSTIYKMNRNFHYFSWHTCLYLATAQREPAETEEALRGAVWRGGCCCHPCQPSPCWLCLLGKAVAFPLLLARAIYNLHNPREEGPLRATFPGGWAAQKKRVALQTPRVARGTAWGHCSHGVSSSVARSDLPSSMVLPPILLLHSTICFPHHMSLLGYLVVPDSVRIPTSTMHRPFSPSSSTMGMRSPPAGLLLVLMQTRLLTRLGFLTNCNLANK